jgi:hypothetical protein
MKTSKYTDSQILAILRWNGCLAHGKNERAGRDKPSPQKNVHEELLRAKIIQEAMAKKVVKSSQRKDMAQAAVTKYSVTISRPIVSLVSDHFGKFPWGYTPKI